MIAPHVLKELGAANVPCQRGGAPTQITPRVEHPAGLLGETGELKTPVPLCRGS